MNEGVEAVLVCGHEGVELGLYRLVFHCYVLWEYKLYAISDVIYVIT